jgi:hypothetical protein
VTQDPSVRASDADRQAAADRLQEAHAEGRLTLEEFEERIERTLAAKTLGDLDVVTRDLPAVAAPLAAPTHAPAPATPYTGREAPPGAVDRLGHRRRHLCGCLGWGRRKP